MDRPIFGQVGGSLESGMFYFIRIKAEPRFKLGGIRDTSETTCA